MSLEWLFSSGLDSEAPAFSRLAESGRGELTAKAQRSFELRASRRLLARERRRLLGSGCPLLPRMELSRTRTGDLLGAMCLV
jgi:hypothetical protein